METVKIENWIDVRELALMSIGTNKGAWWADENFGSELWLLQKSGKVDGQTAGALQRMIQECLQWMLDDMLVRKITCATERTSKNTISYTVVMERPSEDDILIKEVWSVV
jgi:phage gp46-like protein